MFLNTQGTYQLEMENNGLKEKTATFEYNCSDTVCAKFFINTGIRKRFINFDNIKTENVRGRVNIQEPFIIFTM